MAEVGTFYQSQYTGEQLDEILKNVYDAVPLDGSKPMTGPLTIKEVENGYTQLEKNHTQTTDLGTALRDVSKGGSVVALLLKAADQAARLQFGTSVYDLIHTGNIQPYVKPFADAAEAASEEAAAALAGVKDAINNIPEGAATPIVNDLTTGGTSMALSAEMGKFLKGEVDGLLALVGTGAGYHNSVYRGKFLGNAVTAAQYSAIAAGTFDDLYIGDYWTIGDINYRIAAFDYYRRTGDTSCNTPHVTVVPDAALHTHVMNDTNVTTGAYIGSKMYTEGLTQAKTTINIAFGEAHVLNHRRYLENAVTDGYASGGSWYDSTVELMTEQNVFGCKIYGNQIGGTALPDNITVDKSQYPLFTFRPDLISNRQTYWLRDVVSAAYFASVNFYGVANYYLASSARGVRPAFSIIG